MLEEDLKDDTEVTKRGLLNFISNFMGIKNLSSFKKFKGFKEQI